tara:strand:- start:1350 stop:2030 length:681 start_codon:yes stop_codon:yes gene_type:complete
MSIRKKLLKHFIVQQLLALIAFIYIVFVKITSNIKYENIDSPKKYWQNKKPFILAFWHGQLMTFSYTWKINKKLNILASSHSDGRFGASIARYFKLNNIPISSDSNNLSLRPIFKILNSNNYIAITPDGPRGPKEKVSEGIIKIAKISKVPIIPVGFGSSKNFCLKSWDSFLITLPFSKCRIVWGDSITIPENLEDQEIATYKKIIEEKINECVKKAKENLYDKSL